MSFPWKRLPIIAVLLLGPLLRAQVDTAVFEHLTTEDGLSGNFVRCIVQDQEGFLWIGTQNGLNRYDGYDFQVFKPDPADSRTLSNNSVQSLYVDRRGQLWVGTNEGLNLFHPETQNFSRFMYDPDDDDTMVGVMVNDIAEDADGLLWVAHNGGLSHLNPDTGAVRLLQKQSGGLPNNTVRAVLIEPSGRLWAGTAGGLAYSDDSGESFTVYRHDPTDPTTLGGDHITSLLYDDQGVLWVGIFGGGLSRLNMARNDFTTFVDSDDRYLGVYRNIVDLYPGRNGTIWIATLEGIQYSGIHRFDPLLGTAERYSHDPSNPRGLTWNYATSVYVDRSGILWAGTSRGLNKLDEMSRKFNIIRQYPQDLYNLYDNFYAIHGDSQGSLWMGLDLGMVLELNRESGQVRAETIESFDGSEGGTYAIHEDRQNRLWFTSASSGLVLFDRQTRKKTYYMHTPDDPTTISGNNVSSLHGDADGILWVGTSAGLNRFDPDSGTFKNWRHDPDNPKSLSSDSISVVYRDCENTLWAGTGPNPKFIFTGASSGLNRYNAETDDFTVFRHDPTNPASLSDNQVTFLYEDTRGNFWVGTNNGLNRMNRERGSFRHYLQRDGLPSAVMRGILEDEAGMLWISTVNGLSRFDAESETFRNYDVNDGLQHDRFNNNSFFKSNEGEMFFGGVRGMNAFFPDRVRDNQYKPNLVFTDFRIFGTSVVPDEESVLNRHISRTNQVILDHNQNDIGLSFTALHFSRPQKNQYQFYLENYERNWRTAGPDREVSYTNLDPGVYTFRVKAANSDGVWNDHAIQLEITITPPWWTTWWAYTFYTLAALLVLALVLRAQVLRAQRQVELKAREEREASRLREAELARKAAQAQAKAVEADNLRKTEELEKARRLQLSMLPRGLPDLEHITLAASSQTATEVGGDYYDFRVQADGTLILAVGDATGHGLHAGTLVAATKSLFNALAGKECPRAFLEHGSNALKDMGFHNMYMGMLIARIHERRLTIAGAGMPFPLIYRALEDTVEEIPFRTLPMGALTNYPYQERETELEPGDVLLLMSDGLPEMFNNDNQILGGAAVRNRFQEVARENPQEIIRALTRFGRDWAGDRPQEDDTTMMAVRQN